MIDVLFGKTSTSFWSLKKQQVDQVAQTQPNLTISIAFKLFSKFYAILFALVAHCIRMAQWVSCSNGVFGHQGADAADAADAVTVAVEVQLDNSMGNRYE